MALIIPLTSSLNPGLDLPMPTFPLPPGIITKSSSESVVISFRTPEKLRLPVIVSPVVFTQLSVPAAIKSEAFCPSSKSALRLVTAVVDETVRGAVPVATVEIN